MGAGVQGIDLQGKVVLVSGAARGIGAAIAQRCALAGAAVMVTTGSSEAEARAVVQAIEAAGGRAEFRLLDVRNDQRWQEVVDETVAIFGGLDALVNNAGVSGVPRFFVDTSLQELRDIMSINLDGAYLAPGLIDAHVHIESSLVPPSEYAAAVVPSGTTTVVTDPHEIANVLGLDGIRFMFENAKRGPMSMYVMASSCVPATDMETNGATLRSYDLASFLFDAYVDIEPETVAQMVDRYIEALPSPPAGDFRRRFETVAVERMIKALGTFGYQIEVRGNSRYRSAIPRTLERLHRLSPSLPERFTDAFRNPT